MSSILKALRKLEDEKATLGEGSVDLAHDILKRSYDEGKQTPWLAILLIFMALLAFGGGVWLFYLSKIESQPTTDVVPQATQPKTVAVPQQLQVKQTSVAIDVPAQKAKITITPPVKKIAEQPPVEVPERSVSALVPVVEPEPIDIPLLTVEEIVYHQQSESRLAIINDLPVMEGTDILGAHVEEILPDRVRFTFKGVRFNKFLSPSE